MSIQRKSLIDALEERQGDTSASARIVAGTLLWHRQKITTDELADLILHDTDPPGHDIEKLAEKYT